MTKQRLQTILVCFFLIAFIACEKDSTTDDNSDDQQAMQDNHDIHNDDDSNDDETNDDDSGTDNEDSIDLAQLNTDITVNGAQRVDGAPPAPNGSLDFQIGTDDQSGFLGTGFQIEVSSLDNATGAYILFTDVDGNKADSYFDINFEDASSKKAFRSKNARKRKLEVSKVLEDQIIEVVFNQEVPTGEFCYEICLYDEANNVSEIVTRCVVVDEWGGDTTLVGSWMFDRELENGVDISEEVGTRTITCDNNSQITVDEEIISKDEWLLVLEADGDYYEEYDFSTNPLDFEATQVQCQADYEDQAEEYNDRYLGKWSFDNSKLTIVDFAYEDLNDPSENETYENGSIYLDGIDAEIVNGELVLTETVNIDGQVTTYEAIFKPVN